MMRGVMLTVAAMTLVLAAATPAAAEFGPESEDGFPINVEGEVVRPPVAPQLYLPHEVPDWYYENLEAHAHGPDGDEAQAAPLNKAGPVTLYPYYPLLTAEVQRLAEEHPDLVKLGSIGQSQAGLEQWSLEIADWDRIEAGDGIPVEERERIYIDGGTHSNEYSGVYFVTEVAQFLLDEYETNETAQWIVENRHTLIVPLVNPDGSNAFGRLNANTVNINRNFPVLWGAIDESPVVNNPGPEPMSEVETQNVVAAAEAFQPDYAVSIHCCGNLWLHPWGVESEDDAVDMEMFTTICDEVFADVREDCGETWSTIYPASGITSDTIYAHTGASSWSYEMSGRGAVAPWGQPAIQEDPREQEVESWDGVLHAMLNAERYGAHLTVDAITGDAEELIVRITNDGYGPLVAGTLTLGEASVDLPEVGPGNSTTLTLEGDFSEGTTDLSVTYPKRVFETTNWKTTDVALDLVEEDGDLVAYVLGADGEQLTPLSADSVEDGANGVPAPGAAALLGLLGLAAVALRRRG